MTASKFDGSVTGRGGELLKTQPKLFIFWTFISSIEQRSVLEINVLLAVVFELLKLAF
jgi:hypothetical protein